MTSAVRVSCGLYKMLLFTYPSDFRLRFESEMVTTFSDLICGEWKHNGLPGVARVAVRSRGGVFCSCATSTAKPDCDGDVAIFAFVDCLIYGGISRNDACLQRRIVNGFSWSKRLSVFASGRAVLD